MTPDTLAKVHVRWMVASDINECEAIDYQESELAWTEGQLDETLRRKNVIGMVAEKDVDVIGFIVYELNKGFYRLLKFVALPGSGGYDALIAKLHSKLSNVDNGRKFIVCNVEECDVPLQLRLSKAGFQMVEQVTAKCHHDDVRTQYIMRLDVPAAV
jgi:hypothetical protein